MTTTLLPSPGATSDADAPAAATPQVAVLIPVYNDDGRLADTLESLADQGVPCLAVVVDDGSTPPLAVDVARCPVPVVVLRQPANGGIERALNAGLEYIAAAGIELVARLDNGDRCAPQRLAKQQRFLARHPDVALVGSNVEWRRDDGSLAFRLDLPRTHEQIARALHHTVCLIHPTVMFRTSVIAEVGAYSTAYPAAEDFELFWRIARRHRVANLPEVLLVTRFDPGGISIRRRRRQLGSKLRIQLRFFRLAEPRSYLGLARTLALMSVPYGAVVQLKHWLGGTRRPAGVRA